MVFSSPVFLFYFLPLVLAVYYLLPIRARNGFLTAASYVFYGWLHVWLVLLMFLSTLIDWQCGRWITSPGASVRRRKAGVMLSIVANLGILSFFKYGVFAQENANRLLTALGQETFGVFQIVLPLGISFYTFQSMSYSIDLYRGRAQPARSLLDFTCFVALFPQLVAGPIVRYIDLEKQLRERPQRGEHFGEGALIFVVGFIKKIAIANTLGQAADVAFAADALPAHAAWFGLAAYTFQLYFDFTGYSEMAIGLGLMFGFRLPVNFRSPLRSQGFTEFWQRWHITLSTWLRDYLYVPLGGNRRSAGRVWFNLWVTMLLAGLWHGSEWQFVVFGAVHGSLLGLERMCGRRPAWHALPKPGRVACMFVVWMLTLVLFRADDLAHAGRYYGALFAGRGADAAGALLAGRLYTAYFAVAMAVAAVLVWAGRESSEVVHRAMRNGWLCAGLLAVFALAVVMMFAQAENPFIYFRF